MDNQAYAVPLVELLRDVPKDSRLIIEGNYSSRHIPVGRHCHEAAIELDSLRAQLAEVMPQVCKGDDTPLKCPDAPCTQCVPFLRAQLAERDRQIAETWKALNTVPWAWTADLDPLFRALAKPEEPNP